MQPNKKKKKKAGRIFVFILLIPMIFLCIGSIIYPLFSTWYSEKTRSEIQTQYEAVIAENSTENLDAIRQAAIAWNEALYNDKLDLLSLRESGYFDQLKVEGTDMIARVRIPCINVDLPVYHTDDASVLDYGAGHLEQTSLPVGGPNTHAFISAHSGMASAEMFSNLERMKIGDIFFIDVLGETLTYEVRSIDVVLPTDISSITIEKDMDLVTLLTCTPYGVNTHRLLVTGSRIETPVTTDDDGNTVVDMTVEDRDTGNVWLEHYIMALTVGAILALIFIVICIIVSAICRKKRKKSRKQIKWSVKTYTEKTGDGTSGEIENK